MNTQRIVPNIWCNNNATEVGHFYVGVFDRAAAQIESSYPLDGLPEFQRGFEGKPLTVGLSIDDFRMVLVNAGPEFRPNPSISFLLTFDPARFGGDVEHARGALLDTWQKLSSGGREIVSLDPRSFAAQRGWCEDRIGVNWQLELAAPGAPARPFVRTALLFSGAASGRAAEAAAKYSELFADAEVVRGESQSAEPGALGAEAGAAFAELRIGDDWLALMDDEGAGESPFSCGVSLEVSCDGQAEIDRLWHALSAVPEAEQCGWLADEFGVSWQIVPNNMDVLMQRPGAFDRLLSMKKLVIADF